MINFTAHVTEFEKDNRYEVLSLISAEKYLASMVSRSLV